MDQLSMDFVDWQFTVDVHVGYEISLCIQMLLDLLGHGGEWGIAAEFFSIVSYGSGAYVFIVYKLNFWIVRNGIML